MDFVGVRDINSYNPGNFTKCELIANDLHIANIDSIKYISDGRFLNATVWLSEPFSYLPNSTIYGNVTTSLDIGSEPTNNVSTPQDLLENSIKFHKKYAYFKPIENKTIFTKNGYAAYVLIYEMAIKNGFGYGIDMKNAEIGITIGNKFILLEFSSLPALFSYKLPILYKIIDSIRFSEFSSENKYKLSDNWSNFSTYINPYFISMIYPSNWTDGHRIYSLRDNYTGIERFELSHVSKLHQGSEVYNMLIDIHSTFDEGYDYMIRYRWDREEIGWTKYVAEISSNGHYRILDYADNVFKNQSKFIDNFILMNFDLHRANYPNQHSVYIYKENLFNFDDYSCYIIDTTGWIPIPPPGFFITASPSSLELRPNDEKIVKIAVHNNSSLNADFSIYDKIDPEVSVTAIPSSISLLPNGDTNIILRIKNNSNRSYF